MTPQTQFLHQAVDVLCHCRNTLMYTYAFAFYLVKNNQCMIFEVSSPPTSLHWTLHAAPPLPSLPPRTTKETLKWPQNVYQSTWRQT